MRRAPAPPPRSTSTSNGLHRAAAVSAFAFAVLLIGGLTAWALPALARSGARVHRTTQVARIPAAATATTATATPNSPATATLNSPATSTHGSTAAATTDTAPTTSSTAVLHTRETAGSAVVSVGSWSPPFTISAPVAADLIAPVIAVSAANGVAVGSGQTNEDAPERARAAVLSAGALDVFSTHLAPVATEQTLAAGYLGDRLVVLTATSTGGGACCSNASTQSVLGGELQTPEPLASGLAGAANGALVPVRGGLLAAVDNQAGITVARSDASGAFGSSEQLIGADTTPPLMAAGPLQDGGAIVAWTAPASDAETIAGTPASPGSSPTAEGYDQPRNQLIAFATAGPSGAPGRARLAVTVPAGRQIDALGVVPHDAGATLAWTESWYFAGHYLSQVFWADLTADGVGQPRALSSAASGAVGVSLAGTSAGREVLSWQACEIGAGTCVTQAALRPDGDAWGPVRSLGPVDPTSFPVASQSSRGQSLVAWISNGVVYGASGQPDSDAFSAAQRISGADTASDLALDFGEGTRAAAVWVQGTFDEKLVGARFTP
jgi:hypothetical protein